MNDYKTSKFQERRVYYIGSTRPSAHLKGQYLQGKEGLRYCQNAY